MQDVVLLTASGEPPAVSDAENVAEPLVVKGEVAAAAGQAQALPAPDSILAAMRLANRYFMAKWPDPGRTIITNIERPSNIWTRAVYYEGLLALYGIDPQAEYYDYAVRWGEAHGWDLRAHDTYTRNADDQAAGQTYIDLYRIDPRPERIRAIRAAIDSMLATEKIDDWNWIDAIQMCMPVFAKLGALQQDPRYWERMFEMYRFTRERHGDHGLFNAADGLWWRDADFDPPATSPAGRNIYWARGNGWVFMALARVLNEIPESAPHRDTYLADFRALADAVRQRQREDGFWNVSLDDPAHFGGPETSGTAMFAFGLAWGIGRGLLDPTEYGPAVARAWRALAQQALHADGFLGYVQSTGKQPSEGQPVTYARPPDFEDYALGAFLLAGSEVYRLAGGR
ncbi:MAG: glycoside hydrolase family 88 protein [Gemmatimonadetes bacterium]|nr:glycoside hydrolase family 88 protein [Gemmatimonadota bacterium]